MAFEAYIASVAVPAQQLYEEDLKILQCDVEEEFGGITLERRFEDLNKAIGWCVRVVQLLTDDLSHYAFVDIGYIDTEQGLIAHCCSFYRKGDGFVSDDGITTIKDGSYKRVCKWAASFADYHTY